jgi:ammonia channel protein AmtB
VGTVVIMTIVKLTVGVRSNVREEITGLDLSEHGEEAYPGGVGIGEGVIFSATPAGSPSSR